MEVVRAAARHLGSVAVRHEGGPAVSYGRLLECSEAVASTLRRSLPAAPPGATDGPRVGIWAEPGAAYVAATWATWLAGGVAVPLSVSHPPHELQYVAEDAGVSAVLTGPSGHDKLSGVAAAAGAALHVLPDDMFAGADSYLGEGGGGGSGGGGRSSGRSSSESSGGGSRAAGGSGALVIYTSGTTGRPKGALHTHGSLMAQVRCLVDAWRWRPDDAILHALPLHHVHGIVNALHCAHYSGAAVNFMHKFSAAAVWRELVAGSASVLMAVPTMFAYLLSHHELHMDPREQALAAAAAGRLRLAVSGSAAAPVPLLRRWEALSGQRLLERYGMTEAGMILSNPYEGERRPGFVGLPLPGVELKVVRAGQGADGAGAGGGGDDGGAAGAAGAGELAVRGPALFREYWGRPEATAAAFDADGFFLTGDTVSEEGDPPYYRVLGRSSVDIIKMGGFKLSALDVESVLMRHPRVAEAAVLGVPHDALGQEVAALVFPKQQQVAAAAEGADGGGGGGKGLAEELAALCGEWLPPYSVPRRLLVLERPLPRNAMGKVNKKELLAAFFPAEAASGGGGAAGAAAGGPS